MVKSEFSSRYFYFFPLFLIVFDILIAYGLLQSTHPIHEKDVFFIFLVIGSPLLLILLLLLRKRIVLRIWPDKIQLRGIFSKKTIHKDEINSINLSAREIAGLFGNFKPTNAIVIEWGEKDRFVLLDFFYRNVPALKKALQDLYIAGPGSVQVLPDSPTFPVSP
jgi:hypothetical protein